MMMEGEGVLRTVSSGAPASGLSDALSAWEFQWAPKGASEQWAHVTGQLRWRGFDLGFSADGLLGVDGRLSAPSVATLPAHLQQVVLQHFADECFSPLKGSPLGDMSLLSLQWHDDPLPMEGEFEFTLKRTELARVSRGRLTVFDRAGRMQLINTLASLQWPLPQDLSFVRGSLQIGSVLLSTEQCNGLEVGDLVWLDDAEVAPSGLRALFTSPDEPDTACFTWIKRSQMLWQCNAAGVASSPEGVSGDATVFLKAISPEFTVQRAWCQGVLRHAPMAQTALSLPWQLSHEGQARCEGQLRVVGRRMGLRVTRVF
jgi:hypothetical protein